MLRKIRNEYTGKILEINLDSRLNYLQANIDSALYSLMKNNFKGIEYYGYHYYENVFSSGNFKLLNENLTICFGNFEIEYDLYKLHNNVLYDDFDNVNVSLHGEPLVYAIDYFVKKNTFKYFELYIHNILDEFYSKLLRMIAEYEISLEEDDIFSNDIIEDMYNILVEDYFG